MNKPFVDGFTLITKMIERKEREYQERIYFLGTPNGTNEKYSTFGEFRRAMSAPKEEKSEQQILDEVKNILDSF